MIIEIIILVDLITRIIIMIKIKIIIFIIIMYNSAYSFHFHNILHVIFNLQIVNIFKII